MNADQRHQAILAALRVSGRVHVTELAGEHDVTVETIRRDLAALDRAGLLRKVHGGAITASQPETAVDERELAQSEAKARIAARALKSLDLSDGATVLIDAGTTTGAFARLLPEDRHLTVLTDSVLIAGELAARSGMSVRMIGGRVRGLTQAAVGPEALDLLATLRVDVAVIGTNGLTVGHGLSTPDPDEAAVKRAMIDAARRCLVLADSTKIGQEHLVSFARAEDIDVLVTDAPLPVRLATHLHDTGTEVDFA